jgi:hypothetical protein
VRFCYCCVCQQNAVWAFSREKKQRVEHKYDLLVVRCCYCCVCQQNVCVLSVTLVIGIVRIDWNWHHPQRSAVQEEKQMKQIKSTKQRKGLEPQNAVWAFSREKKQRVEYKHDLLVVRCCYCCVCQQNVYVLSVTLVIGIVRIDWNWHHPQRSAEQEEKQM